MPLHTVYAGLGLLLLFSLLSLGWPLKVHGAETDESAPFISLNPMVITASRSPMPLADAPVRTQILRADDIERLHSRDIRDALRMLPGIQLREIHGKTGEEVMLQGLNGDRVLILVDGLPVSATTGSTVDTSQLSALDIEQIEVIPGAASALYGSAAMGGVINIITRDTPSGSGGRVAFQAGTYGESRELSDTPLPQRHLLASGHTHVSGVKAQATLDRRTSSETDLNTDTYPSNGFDGDKTEYSLRLQNDVDQATKAHQWQLDTGYYDEDLSNRRLSNAGYEGTKTETLGRWRMSLQGSLPADKGNWRYSLLHETQQNETAQLNNDLAIPAGNLWRSTGYQQQKGSLQREQTLGLLGGYRLRHTSGLEVFRESIEQDKTEYKLTAEGAAEGADIHLEPGGYYRIETTEVAPESRHSGELFSSVMATRDNGQGLTLEWSPGARWQFDSDFGGYVSPAMAARQAFSLGHSEWQLQLRESVGVGYRVPNLKNRYYIFDHSINGYKVLGDPDLEPEYSRSYQVSASLTDLSRWHLEASVFYNRIYDLIEAASTGEYEDGGRVAIYRYTNLANARTRGYEFSVQGQFSKTFRQRLSYAWLDARDLDAGAPLINRAEHVAKLMLTWQPHHRWDLTLTGEYQGGLTSYVNADTGESIQSPDTVRWDLKTGYQANDQLLLMAGINNLSDAVRDPLNPYDRRPTQGRFPYIGLDFRI